MNIPRYPTVMVINRMMMMKIKRMGTLIRSFASAPFWAALCPSCQPSVGEGIGGWVPYGVWTAAQSSSAVMLPMVV
jgi:hypothetical protein